MSTTRQVFCYQCTKNASFPCNNIPFYRKVWGFFAWGSGKNKPRGEIFMLEWSKNDRRCAFSMHYLCKSGNCTNSAISCGLVRARKALQFYTKHWCKQVEKCVLRTIVWCKREKQCAFLTCTYKSLHLSHASCFSLQAQLCAVNPAHILLPRMQ